MQYKFKNSQLYRRILVCFLVLMLPTLALGVYFYHHTCSNLIAEARSAIQAHLQSASSQIESQLLQLYYFDSLVSSSTADDMNEIYAADSPYKVSKALNDVATQLGYIRQLNDGMIDIAIYINDETICTGMGVFPTDYYFASVCQYEDYTAEDFVNLTGRKKLCLLNPTSVIYYNSTPSISSYAQKYNALPVTFRYQTVYGNGVTIYTLDLSYFLNLLENLAPYEGIHFAIQNSDGQLIASTDPLPDSFTDEIYVHLSSANVYNYIAWIPQSSVFQIHRSALALILLVIGMLILTELLLALLIGHRFSRPLMNIYDMLDSRPEADIRHLNDIELQVSSMLQQLDGNEATISHLTQSYVKSVLPTLLQNNYHPNLELLNFLLAQQFGSQKPMRCVVVQTENDDVQKSIVREEFSEYFLELNFEFMPCYLLFIVADEEARTRTLFERLHARLAARLPSFPPSLFIGALAEKAEGLADSLDSALTLAQTQKDSQVVYADDISIAHQYRYTYQDELNLIAVVKRGDAAGTHELLEQILTRNEEARISYSQMQRLYTLLINTAARYAESEKLSLTLPAQTEFVLSQRPYVHRLYDDLLTQMKPKEGSSYLELVENVNQFIEAHLSQELFLDAIATEFGITGKHLARVYKQETGIALTEHIIQTRIALAKELLKNTDMPVSQIMKQTGYSDRTTFMRNFKKVTGVAPQTFREVGV